MDKSSSSRQQYSKLDTSHFLATAPSFSSLSLATTATGASMLSLSVKGDDEAEFDTSQFELKRSTASSSGTSTPQLSTTAEPASVTTSDVKPAESRSRKYHETDTAHYLSTCPSFSSLASTLTTASTGTVSAGGNSSRMGSHNLTRRSTGSSVPTNSNSVLGSGIVSLAPQNPMESNPFLKNDSEIMNLFQSIRNCSVVMEKDRQHMVMNECFERQPGETHGTERDVPSRMMHRPASMQCGSRSMSNHRLQRSASSGKSILRPGRYSSSQLFPLPECEGGQQYRNNVKFKAPTIHHILSQQALPRSHNQYTPGSLSQEIPTSINGASGVTEGSGNQKHASTTSSSTTSICAARRGSTSSAGSLSSLSSFGSRSCRSK